MTFAKRVFLVAGLYGLVTVVPFYFLEARIGRDQPPPISHPEYYYGFLGVVVAWQLVFLLLSRDPVRYRLLMLPSIVEKLAFGLAVLVLVAQDRVAFLMVGPAIIDLAFAVAFGLAYARTPRRG
jgi:hypothetical protein